MILVETEDARNLGFVARAMKCHQIFDLRLVHSQWNEVPDQALITGVAAKDVLAQCRFYPTLDQALADCDLSVALSRRKFDQSAQELWLRDLPQFCESSQKVGVVFGRESQGLFQDEINLCHAVCGIPVQGTMSYNLGQAAAIALYELCGRLDVVDRPQSEEIPAPQAQVEALLELMSNRGGDDFASGQRRLMQIRSLLLRARPRAQEIKTLFGLIKRISE